MSLLREQFSISLKGQKNKYSGYNVLLKEQVCIVILTNQVREVLQSRGVQKT